MAYNFIPKTSKEIEALKLPNGAELVALLTYVQNKTKVPDPLSMDKNTPKKIKVMRKLNGKVSLPELRKIAPSFMLDFGNGSRGALGAGNKGLGFESDLIDDFNLFIKEGMSAKFGEPAFMQEFDAMHGLSSAKNVTVKQMGGLNQKRSLVLVGDQPYIKGPDFDVGSTVTDVDVIIDSKKVHISAKYGSTVTFFNSGVSTILGEKAVKSYNIPKDGLIVLDTFGIDPEMFCDVFNKYGKPGGRIVEVNTFSNINRNRLHKFLMSGVGYGYHLAHKIGNKVHNMVIEKSDLERITRPLSCVVRYPVGSAKRVDMFVETPMFQLKLNIRNKQGGTYPSHILSDYTTKH